MALDGPLGVIAPHAQAVVAHADEILAPLHDLDRDGMGLGIERVLDQLLDDGCRAFHDLAGCDLVDEIVG